MVTVKTTVLLCFLMTDIDAMQLCMNGHHITNRYHSQPKNRQRFCSRCGAETIKECLECGNEIPGDDLDSNVVVAMPTAPPKHCEYCGSSFPWTTVPEENRRDVSDAISDGESETIEFKEELPSHINNISKEVVALSNYKGGILLIGVNDDGDITGVNDIDESEERVTGTINSNVEPKIRTAIEKVVIQEKSVLAIHIPRAEERPYNVDGTFYIRSGTSVEKMSSTDLSKWFS